MSSTAGQEMKQQYPFEIEEGRAYQGTEKAARPGVCRRYRCLFITGGILLIIGILLAILIPLLKPRMPKVQYLGGSSVSFSLTEGAQTNISIQFTNPNVYTLKLTNLNLDIHDYRGRVIGQLKHDGTFRIPSKRTRVMVATATIPLDEELIAVAVNCLGNDLKTTMSLKGKVKGSALGVSRTQSVGPIKQDFQCINADAIGGGRSGNIIDQAGDIIHDILHPGGGQN